MNMPQNTQTSQINRIYKYYPKQNMSSQGKDFGLLGEN